MMLNHLGETKSASHLQKALETCISNDRVTPDMGGSLTTEEVTREVIQHLKTTAAWISS